MLGMQRPVDEARAGETGMFMDSNERKERGKMVVHGPRGTGQAGSIVTTGWKWGGTTARLVGWRVVSRCVYACTGFDGAAGEGTSPLLNLPHLLRTHLSLNMELSIPVTMAGRHLLC